VYKGLLGGRRGWLYVGAALWAPRLLKKLFGRNEEVVSVDKLRRDQGIHLETFVQPSKREWKRAQRAASARPAGK
jgi:hypothetical protein